LRSIMFCGWNDGTVVPGLHLNHHHHGAHNGFAGWAILEGTLAPKI
jgi:hypothetical protein